VEEYSCIFKIDPSECGFQLDGKGSQIFGQDGQHERLKHSQSKGLTPILKMFQRMFTKYIVEQLDEDYEFIFSGIEQEDQVTALDMDVKMSGAGFMSLEDGFEKWSGRKFNPEKDTILNQVYLQIQGQKQMGGEGMNEEADGGWDDEEEGNESGNPFEKSLLKSLDLFGGKNGE
jgi:hypothetical protein